MGLSSTLSRAQLKPIGTWGALVKGMKHWLVSLIIVTIGLSAMAKSTCTIAIESAMGEFKDNAVLNERLKKHQKLKSVTFSVDLENLRSEKNNKINLVFTTTQDKKFETTYTAYNKNAHVWKIDFSTSQIFPQLFKNYLNVTLYNSKYYFRMYDTPSEKTIVNLVFDASHCTSTPKTNVLSRARVSP